MLLEGTNATTAKCFETFLQKKQEIEQFLSIFLYFCNQIAKVMSMKLSIQEALKRVRLNTVTLK